MIKRVNSTGRRRIPRDKATIEVFDGTPRTFDAVIDLADFDASPEAAVILEATCAGSNVISRFEWGTLGTLTPPERRELTQLHGENVFFSLKVIDRSERFGRILGLAENIRPLKGGKKTATGRKGILPVDKADLGDELWRLEFRETDVFLLVNERVPGLADQVKFDAAVFALIYPNVIREILRRALDEEVEPEDEGERWPSLWLQFARHLHPDHEAAPTGGDDDSQGEWIADVVQAFCREHALREKFIQRTGEPNWEASA